ncbi:MAG: chemotaxis protein CheW [Gammaproteobacteria bacterium]|jgi:purine-binding chemotaxis protein CheW|nr:chemotaxis protein CheW [Gammaproteobacteria bacterium]
MNATSAEAVQVTEATGQYLTFELAGEQYGMDILRVQEIRGWSAVTPIPSTPECVQGVLNLRGTVVPIIDLRRRLGMPRIDYGATTVIVVANVVTAGRERLVGLIVDAVSDVCDVTADDARPTPDFGASVDVRYMHGMAALGERMVVLLDIDRLLDDVGRMIGELAAQAVVSEATAS